MAMTSVIPSRKQTVVVKEGNACATHPIEIDIDGRQKYNSIQPHYHYETTATSTNDIFETINTMLMRNVRTQLNVNINVISQCSDCATCRDHQ